MSTEPTLSNAQRWVVAVGLYVGLSGVAPVAPLRDAVSLEPAEGARLLQPIGYLVGAPLFGLWDTLSLLSLPQHFAVLATLAAFYVSWRRKASTGRGSRLLREAQVLVASVGVLLGFYLAGALLPRPMTGLELDDPERVVIDFHSHTDASHDGRAGFGAERNRSWHAAGGFHAAYVTDHYGWRGYDAGRSGNPDSGGDGVLLLEGAELRIHRRPTVALGTRATYVPALDADSVYLSADVLRARVAAGSSRPTLLYTMPGALRFVVPWTPADPTGVIGIEIHDASPRGLEQTRSERAAIVALADSLDLALVGVSNLHGWGRTASAWSIMRIDGWRALGAERLSFEIEDRLHRERREAVEVVERSVPHHDDSSVRIALTVPLVLLHHGRSLSWGERTSWLLWLLVVALAHRVGAAKSGRTRLHVVEGQ